MLSNYKAYKGNEVCLIFDGYNLKDNLGSKEDINGIHIVYTKEGLSADGYIESLISEIGKNYSVRVATSDGMIQLTALRAGVIRMSNSELKYELDSVFEKIDSILKENNLKEIKLSDIAKHK